MSGSVTLDLRHDAAASGALRMRLWLTIVLFAAVSLAGCHVTTRQDTPADHAARALLANQANGANWPGFGRTFDENHYSPLTQVSPANIGRLGLVASLDLPSTHNAGTVPLAVDGVIYFAVDQSIVRAYDVRKRALLWTFDPKTMAHDKLGVRQGWGVRGIAWWAGKIYVGTSDGRLIALDAKTGAQSWSVDTLEGRDEGYISGPPRAFGGLVLIGFGGADYGNCRGYVTAYDAATGKKIWRFFTVPGDPSHKDDEASDSVMPMAAKTWHGKWWKLGGGGTVWNAMTYDPELDQVYIGVGNGGPWNQKVRSPGGGDNLFLASIVALDAKTGAYRWHYQANPGDSWDYTATMDIELATATIAGKPRKLLFQAPKNGFFYVIDRTNGKLISAEKIAKVTWASKVDLTTGRPVENPAARYYNGKPALQWPSSVGAHNWAPMSYDPRNRLVFIPTNEMPGYYDGTGVTAENFKFVRGKANTGVNFGVGDVPANAGTSTLQAWDPIRQKQVWSVKTPGILNGGTMATATGIVFQGRNDGYLNAYEAVTGKQLWQFNAMMGIAGAPIAFAVDGKQYIAVVAGWGGTNATMMGSLAGQFGWQYRRSVNRLLVFALDGTATLPASPPPQKVVPIEQPGLVIDPKRAEAGGKDFSDYCSGCHGAGAVAGGQVPDLRGSAATLDADTVRQIVKNGLLKQNGMPDFPELNDDQIENIRLYVRLRASQSLHGGGTNAHVGGISAGK